MDTVDYTLHEISAKIRAAEHQALSLGLRPHLIVYLGTHLFQKLTAGGLSFLRDYGNREYLSQIAENVTLLGYPVYEVRPRKTRDGFVHHGVEIFYKPEV